MPDTQPNSKKAVCFLNDFRPTGLINIVAIHPVTGKITAITRPAGGAEITEFIEQHNGVSNLYFMVNTPSIDAPDNKLKKEHVAEINAVWLDADPAKDKPFNEERTRLFKFAKELKASANPPTFIVDSGGGIQAFWMLDKPVSVNDDTRREYEALSRGLSVKYDTDKVQNIDRLMRLPYTWNIPTKKKKGRKEALARLAKTGKSYLPDQLKSFIKPSYVAKADNNFTDIELDMEKVKTKPTQEFLDKFDAIRKRNKKIDDLWNNRIDMKPSRSERDFTLAKELKAEGFSLIETAIILWNFEHGKVRSVPNPAREIIRCYERSGNDFVDSLDPAYIEMIDNQVNPILAAKAAGTLLEEGLDKSARFRAVQLSRMDWRYSGLPIYRDFIYEKAITVIYGKSNTGKSFSATDIAGHIALGLDWNGIRFKPKEEISVLYICAEAGKSYGKRGKALMKKLRVEELPFFVIDAAPVFTKNDKADAEAIVKEIKRLESENSVKIGLVVVDTLATTFEGGNENSSEDMGMYISNMKYIQRYADTGVLIVHHSGKDQAAGARGHSSLQAATDTEIEVTEKDHYRQIEVKKQREGQKSKTIKFKLQPVTLGIDDDGEPIESCYVVVENDAEFEFPSTNPEDELTGTKKAALVTLKRFKEPDFLEFCEGKKASSIRKIMVRHWYLIKNSPEKILSLADLEKDRTDYDYSQVNSNFSGDFNKVKHYFDKKNLTLDQWIKEYLVNPAQGLSS